MWPLLVLLMLAAAASNGNKSSAPGVFTYRTGDGSGVFRFEFVRLGSGEVRIYLLQQPSGSLAGCHVLPEGNRHYLCWDRPIGSMSAAKAVAAAWAEKEMRYLRTGVAF
ncbi:MAG: hypothetical protein HZB25_04535 [Candidatus Eisenbacteria bacterium]|nr:hypothetical protein [Candidatus Eisenbacteria bacterium]